MFLKKKTISFFFKFFLKTKCFFCGNCFSKFVFQILQTFSGYMYDKFVKSFFKFFQKPISKKKQFFFKKPKFLFIWLKSFFSAKKQYVCPKQSALNCPFSKIEGILQIQSLFGLPRHLFFVCDGKLRKLFTLLNP